MKTIQKFYNSTPTSPHFMQNPSQAATRDISHTLIYILHMLVIFVIFNYNLYLLKYQITPQQYGYN